MGTLFAPDMRHLVGRVLTLAVALVALPIALGAQAPTVLPTTVVAVPHNETYGAPWQTAISSKGDLVLLDFKSGGLYEYPANGGAEVTIAAPNTPIGGFDDSGIAIDPRNNNLYVDNNYNNGLLLFPYDTATGLWDLPPQAVATNLAGNLGGACGNYFQSAGLAINSSGLMAVATENGCGVEIFTVPIDASGNFGAAVPIVSNMSARAKTVAIDTAGNISFNEDAGGLTGAFFIPTGTTGLANDKTVARVDPMLTAVQGVTTDLAGNLYIADGTAGEVFVPLQGGMPNPAASFVLSTAPANGGPAFDTARQVLFVPTASFGSFKDLVAIRLFTGEAGSVALGKNAVFNLTYDFYTSTSPGSFVLLEQNGLGDFVVGDTSLCGVPTATVKTPPMTTFAAGQTCTLPVSFTPHTVGNVSATLLMEDSTGKVLSSATLHGIGQSSQADVFPPAVSVVGNGLKTPSQVATDASGNVYVADSGLGKVLEFVKGAMTPVSLGTGLKAPTGVSVDGTGNVYIADSGSVFKIPYAASGLNASGQTTLKTNLGTKLKLAVDAIGDLFIADPDNQRIVQLRSVLDEPSEYDITGITRLSAIAVSGRGNLYAANGPNLTLYSASGANQTMLSTLSGVTGLAIDTSGSVYVAQTGGTLRIPSVNGVLNSASQISVASSITTPTSIATDSAGNIYVTDGTANAVDLIATNSAVNLGTLSTPTSSATSNITVASAGNLPLNISAFTGTPDFSETGTTCVGTALAVGSSCSATITFSPGPGDQGALSGEILLQSDALNPASIAVSGTGAALAASTATLTQVTPPITGKVTFTVSVASATAGGVTPSGAVTVTISGADASGTTITPILVTQTLMNGASTFNFPQLEAGSYTFAANYGGDRVYSRSSTSPAVTVAPDAVIMTQPAAAQVPAYVLSAGSGSLEPTDGSTTALQYVYPVQITSKSGNPLVSVPLYNGNSGVVTFQVAGGSAPCSSTTLVNPMGSALFQTSCLPINTGNNQTPDISTTYTLTPVFTSPDYTTVTGQPFTVTALRHPVVVISSSAPSLSVTAGTPATATLTLTSLLGFGVAGAGRTNNGNNYSLPVALSCGGLPAHATCSFSYPTPDPSDPNSVDVTPTAPGTVMMTVNTNVAVGTSSASLEHSTGLMAFATMFGFSLLGLSFGKQRGLLRKRLSTALCLALAALCLTGLSACSSGSNQPQTVLTSPAGTYTVTVSAQQVGSVVVAGSSPGTTVTVYGSSNLMSLPFTMNVTVH